MERHLKAHLYDISTAIDEIQSFFEQVPRRFDEYDAPQGYRAQYRYYRRGRKQDSEREPWHRNLQCQGNYCHPGLSTITLL